MGRGDQLEWGLLLTQTPLLERVAASIKEDIIRDIRQQVQNQLDASGNLTATPNKK